MGNPRKEFSKIYDQYIGKIYRFIFLKVNSEEIAQDLCSETFLRGWESFKNSNNKIENAQAFLYRIARNLIIDHYRLKGRTQTVSIENITIIDPKSNPEKKMMISSDMEQVKLALTGLKNDYQNVIIWHYLDDLPIAEVAKLLDKSEETTRVTLHRALKSLKSKLDGGMDSEVIEA